MFLLWIKNKNDYKTNIETKYEQNISLNLSEELRNIISNTAHDIKSPCTGVLLGLESLETSIKKTSIDNYLVHQKPHLELIRYMHSTIAFMMMSINRSMDFTKIQGRLDLVPIYENIELSATINWAIECILGQNETNIKLVTTITSLYGYTDKTWLKDNLLCLIGNAVKFTKEGTQVQIKATKITAGRVGGSSSGLNTSNSAHLHNGSFHTTLSLTNIAHNNNKNNNKSVTDNTVNDNTEIEIQMIDNGVNTEDMDRAKFFEQPSQRQRKEGGLGIGLYVLAHRIKALKGTYGSESRTDGQSGSVFWFRIPFDRYRKTNSMTRRHSHSHHHGHHTNRNSQDSNSSIHSNNSGGSRYSKMSRENSHNSMNGGGNINNTSGSLTIIREDKNRGSARSSAAGGTTGAENGTTTTNNDESGGGGNTNNTTAATVAAVASGAFTTITRSLSSFRRSNSNTLSNTNPNSVSFNANKHVGFATSNNFSNENEPFIRTSSSAAACDSGGVGGDEKDNDNNSERQHQHQLSITSSGSRSKLKSNKVSPDLAIEYLTKQSEKIETSMASNSSNSDDENSPLHSQPHDSNNNNAHTHNIRKVSSGSNNANGGSSHSRQNSNHKIVPLNSTSGSSSNSAIITNSSGSNSIVVTSPNSRRNSIDRSNRTISLSSIAANSVSLRNDPNSSSDNDNNIVPTLLDSSNNSNTGSQQPLKHLSHMNNNSLSNSSSNDTSASNINNTKNDLDGLVALVVDDSIPILKMTSYVLKRAGCKVTEAKNGSVALNAIHENRYDLILMDIQMPVMDGFQAVRHIRQHELDMGKKRQIILGMSANVKGSMRKKCLKEGFDGFTAKPFTYEEILNLYRITWSDVENSMSTVNGTAGGSSGYLSVQDSSSSFGVAGGNGSGSNSIQNSMGMNNSMGSSSGNMDNHQVGRSNNNNSRSDSRDDLDDNSSVHSRSSIHSRSSLTL